MAADSSHSTRRASRALRAVQKSWAMTATPLGMIATRSTPRMARASVSWTRLTRAPKRGGCSTRAVSMPGRRTSWVKMAVPSVLGGPSLRRSAALPMSRNWDGSLSFTSVGTGCLAAASASSPKRALLPERWLTTPSLTRISRGRDLPALRRRGHQHLACGAPALRSCSKELAMAVLPPVPWAAPQKRLL